MAKIIVSLGEDIIQELALTKERITIGRCPHNDVVIENLAISGEHAAIVTSGSDYFLEDLNSTNGTLVNGQPIKKHFLQDDDLIALAKYRIRFIGDESGKSALRPADARGKAVESTPVGPAKLKIIVGPNAGRELAVTKDQTTIGRPGVQVAVITRSSRGYSLAHVEGDQLPAINGETVEKVRMLADGDTIQLDHIELLFSLA